MINSNLEYKIYRTQYDKLPVINSVYYLDNDKAFHYCQNRKHFVIVLPYDENNIILVEQAFSDYNDFSWTLIGGSILKEEDFLDCAERLVHKSISNKIELEEFQPVAFIKNTFKYNRKECSHEGIAFITRVANKNKIDNILKNSKCHKIEISSNIHFSNIHNKQIFKIAYEPIEKYQLKDAALKEIDFAKAFDFSKHLERNRKLLEKEESLILKDKELIKISDFKRKISETILKLEPKKILDVACGENLLFAELSNHKTIELACVNDIAVKYLKEIQKKEFKNEGRKKVIFTNHDARNTAFSNNYFDVILVKNLLHHLYEFEEAIKLFEEALRIAKYIVIVEFLHPDEQSEYGKKLHYEYYKGELEESDDCYYYSKEEFENLISKVNRKIIENVKIIETIKGRYLFSVIG